MKYILYNRRSLSVSAQRLRPDDVDKALTVKEAPVKEPKRIFETKDEIERRNRLQGKIAIDVPVRILFN